MARKNVAPQQVNNPFYLSQEEQRQLDDVERLLDEALRVIDRLEACGEPCQTLRQYYDQIRQKVQLLRQYFTPGR